MHSRHTVHVPQDLRATDADAINTGQDGIADVVEFEPSGHIRGQPDRMRTVHELECVLEAQLQDDAVRGVRIGGAVPRAFVEPSKESEIDSTMADGQLVRENAGRPVRVRAEIIDERSVQVECSREVLPVIAESVCTESSHVRNHLRGYQAVHRNLALRGTKLKCSGGG